MWRVRNLLGAAGWFFNSCAFQVGIDIQDIQYPSSAHIPVSTLPYAFVRRLWLAWNHVLVIYSGVFSKTNRSLDIGDPNICFANNR